MDLVLGLDVGTTAVKGMACDRKGQPYRIASCKIDLKVIRTGWVEQDPQEIWNAVVSVCRQINGQLLEGDRICAISLSSQGATTIPVDSTGNPTHVAFSWMDERAGEQASDAATQLGADWIYHTTGWSLFSGMPLNHIAWFKKNCLQDFRKTAKFLFVNDFILHRLGGKFSMDPSNASITQLFGLAKNDWDDRLIGFAGIEKEQLSPIIPSGQVISYLTREAAGLTGFQVGIPVVNGAHDQYCAALGTGVTQPGEALLSCGTAWVVLVVPQVFETAFCGGMCISRHAVPGVWGGIRSMGGIGTSVEWLLQQFWGDLPDRQAQIEAFNRAVSSSETGANGLVFNPLSGGHIETGELENRGMIGLSLKHTRMDIARALLEGVAYELNWMLEEIHESYPITRVKMIGGATRNSTWPQITSDVTGLIVDLPSVSEAASMGAAILAGVGLGWFEDVVSAGKIFDRQRKEIFPDRSRQTLYAKFNQRYREIWGMLPHQDHAV